MKGRPGTDEKAISIEPGLTGRGYGLETREEGDCVAKAYLKVIVEAGMEREVCDALKKLSEVTSADLTTGDQDIIAIVEAPNYETLLKIIVEKMRQIDGITGSSTSLVLD